LKVVEREALDPSDASDLTDVGLTSRAGRYRDAGLGWEGKIEEKACVAIIFTNIA